MILRRLGKNGDRTLTILIEVSTRDREHTLSRFLASLINSSYTFWDLLIINDGDKPVCYSNAAKSMLEIVEQDHRVWIIDGLKKGQAANHNIPLYNPRFRDYDWILRADDDLLFNRYAIERMANAVSVDTKRCGSGVAAVSGLWFENEWASEEYHDRAIPSWELAERPNTDGKLRKINSNWQQRLYHESTEPYLVEHLYSNCLYNTEAMRHVGGWPEIYSRIGHGEETDGTARLYLAGWFLAIDPRATGNHLKSGGGIRSENVHKLQQMDRERFKNRLKEIREIDFMPKVAVWCKHSDGYGGAQRLFYQTVSLLQSKSGLDVYPVLAASHLTPKECQLQYGYIYEEREPQDEYDVCLVFGHEPEYPVEAKRYILYTFFPDKYTDDFDSYSLILAVSDYTRQHIGDAWQVKAKTLYPPVSIIGQGSPGGKGNYIIAPGRLDPHKAPLWLAERFVEFDFDEEWELFIVGGSCGYLEYEQQIEDFAKQHDGVTLYKDMPQIEMSMLYRSARILWSASGIHASQKNPKVAEHFGLTPLEAWSAKTIPVVFDAGGYKEVVHDLLRWNDAKDLYHKTKFAMGLDLKDERSWKPVDLEKYHADGYVRALTDYIYRVNAGAIELERVERIDVTPKKIRVAAISDSPFLTTGFGIVANQIYQRIIDQDDMELCVLGMLDHSIPAPFQEPKNFAFMPTPYGDPMARKTLPEFIKWAKPDVVWQLYDPGTCHGQYMSMKALGQNIPWISYFPVEGLGVSAEAYRLVQAVDYPVTYCRNGSESIAEIVGKPILYIPHGADHASFAPLDPKKRATIRRLVGWNDKFVIYNVGANKRVKQQPYLIDALRILLERGHDDMFLYLHTRMYDNNLMEGWDLKWLIDRTAVETGGHIGDYVMPKPNQKSKIHGTPWEYDKSLDFDALTVPPTSKGRGAIFSSLDYVTRLGLADIYVDVSSAEGWGLPPLEAVACGVPTISVDDGMARSEYHSKYCHMLTPVHWTTWHVGSRLMLVEPEDVADAILDVIENGTGKPYSVMDDLKWEDTATFFVDLIRKSYGRT